MVAVIGLLAGGAYATYWLHENRTAHKHLSAAQQALDRRDFQDAGKHLQQYLALRPNDASIHLLAAQTARRRGDFTEARRELRAHEALKGPEEDRRRELELHAASQGRNQELIESLLSRCLDDPQTPDAYLILEVVIPENVTLLEEAYHAGMTLLEGPPGRDRERTERALALWFEQRPGRADQAQGLVWRGRLLALTNPKEGMAEFRKAVQLDPNHFDARLLLATSLLDFDSREGIGHLEILRQRDPGNAQVATLLAYFQRNLGNLIEAGQLLDEVLAANPSHFSALVERGKVALDAGRPVEAETYLRRALSRSPDDPFLHLALSRSLLLQGRVEEARSHEKRYSDSEAQRMRREQLRSEQSRAAWRKRLEQESLRKGG